MVNNIHTQLRNQVRVDKPTIYTKTFKWATRKSKGWKTHNKIEN
jgi:hypothetical protein